MGEGRGDPEFIGWGLKAPISVGSDCILKAAQVNLVASDEARWVSGIILPVDVGLIVTTPLAMLPYLT